MKQLFQGKQGKWFLAAFGVVLVLGVYFWKKNSSGGSTAELTSYPTYQGNTSSGGSSTPSDGVSMSEVNNLVGSMSRDFGTALKDQQEQNRKMSEQFASSLANTQSSFSQMFSAAYSQNQQTKEQLTGLVGTIGGIESKIGGLESGMNQYKAEVNNKLLATATASMASSYQAPLIDHTDTHVYSSSETYTGNAAVQNTQPNYGYGGGDYSRMDEAGRRAMEANEQKLASDKQYVSSEQKRADQVIAERKKAGLDTREQEEYKDKLNKLQKVG